MILLLCKKSLRNSAKSAGAFFPADIANLHRKAESIFSSSKVKQPEGKQSKG
jgi:hypothetical protein